MVDETIYVASRHGYGTHTRDNACDGLLLNQMLDTLDSARIFITVFLSVAHVSDSFKQSFCTHS